MIRRVQQIKSFGVFAYFRWPDSLPEFKRFNLLYGWNYSGKTTLSRALRCFEKQEPHPDFADAEVQLKSEDGKICDLSCPEAAPLFRVFNSDFVRGNLSFDEGSANPILVLGAEDIVKLGTLKTKKAEREVLAFRIEEYKQRSDDKEKAIERALTKDARDLIKNQLGVPNYDKTRFEPKAIACKDDPQSYLLDDDALTQCLAIYRSTEKKPALSEAMLSLSSVGVLREKAKVLLVRIVTSSNPISRLKENAAVERWVKEGRPLHEGQTACQFCGRPLPPDLLGDLTEHFSTDYENLMAELSGLIKSIQAAQDEGIALSHKADFYPELSDRFMTEKDQLDELLKARKSALESLARAVAAKQTKAFTSLECPKVDDPASQIGSAVEAINKVISEHNNRTAEFDKKRQEAFAKIEKHYAAAFVREQKYKEQLQEIAELDQSISEQGKRLGELDTEILALERELSEASNGAERINELLGSYFGKNDLRIIVSPDQRFQIAREGTIARNLSEGEKTAIAFAYFITCVQDRRYPLADSIIVIDDPISSLDSNHLYNTYALIKTQLAACRQLFISTHSFEFYNLIRDWLAEDEGNDHAKKPQAAWKKWGVFLIRRTDDGTSTLVEMPQELLRFKSEYHYLFSMLYRFDKAGAGDFDCLLSLPNVVRRFMEAFGGIMIPLSTGLKTKMARLFTSEVERERVWKFINHYSHNTTITRSLTIPDTSECKAVVGACLRAVRHWNADYYADLEKEVSA